MKDNVYQREMAFTKICEEEGLDKEKFKALVDDYVTSKQEPLSGDVIACLVNKPSIFKAREIGARVILNERMFSLNPVTLSVFPNLPF